MKRIIFAGLICLLQLSTFAQQQWTAEKANEWYSQQGWLVGADFIPSTAINQLEMWQAATFDPMTIERELGYAQGIGMNCMRVYLHHAAWLADKQGFKNRVKQYLSIANKHKIKTIFVIFDDCWNTRYTTGQQPAPKPGIHNSGWVKDPGMRWYEGEPGLEKTLKEYVTDLLTTFNTDQRILLWDLYNEPGWSEDFAKAYSLAEKVFSWARAVNPSQPLSICIWNDEPKFDSLNKLAVENSDIITYHNYQQPEKHLAQIQYLKKYGRPLICTEYMARKHGSTFQSILPMLKQEGIGAINWGLVDGKTQTKYAWDEQQYSDGSEPTLWFHDIFRKDGTPYKAEETALIDRLTKKN